ncbi:hypothetical protein FO519_006527 [Halicephalobus sp. NKZ332]|nr:hypothetical protein FO519_006527 [Halicephalobus sp. NKZ332]
MSNKVEAGSKGYPEYLQEIGERIKQYADFFKEIIKYSARAGTSTKSMQKALELIQGIPKRAEECIYTDNIEHYPGDRNRLGKIYRHDLFQVWEGDEPPQDRYIFLFKNKLMITEKDNKPDPPVYTHYSTIRLDKYTARVFTADEDTIVLRPNDQGLPSFRIKAKDLQSAEFTRKAWLKDINEMQEEYLASHPDAYSITGTEFDVSMSDVRSEFSEYSNFSRKSSTHTSGPEEGPARKKIKSPPGISPTGSSTSLYSGGSSVDWTTTGTTLEMQGTRVTRTQYGFRTLQESSAKMCLKVTGYPLPDITWYKDDELLKEDERHTFYADEDGFFAMTIDPVQVTDTGRYTCVATNEYGQASTSAFFRVLKVEKESAPPAFVFNLKDQEVKEGEVVSFECEVEGWPEPELVWLVDDQPLRPSHDFRLQYDGQKAKLEIRDAQPEDTGSYAVKLTNEYGTIESAAKLVVQPDPDKNHVPPEFQAFIEDVECNEGDTVKFKAVLTGDPDPEVIWIVNGIPLTESEKIKFISEDGICILTIKDVSRHFDGTVTCQGKNRLGTTNCDAKLRVKVPPTAPSFERPLEDRVITEKNAVMFECVVAGYPDPKVEFLLNGRPLLSGQDGVEILQRDNNYRLTINNTSIEKHAGVLTARAVNEHGSAESRAKLSVEAEEEESRSAPTFIKDIDDKTVKFGEQAKFVTTVRGNPNPTVSWFINGQKLDSSTHGIFIEANGDDHSLTIDSSKYAGTVLCRAENSIGRFETKARLIVLPVEKAKKAPEFVEKLQDKTEIEGGTVVFEARIDAEPRAQFKWTLNGEELKENNRIHFREFDGSIKLEISDINVAESGTIKCTATNSEGESSSEARFTVSKKPSKPVFESRPKNVSVERGQEAVFTCKVDGSPKPEITWAVGGRKVKPGADFARVETSDDGTSKLIIDTNKVFENSTITVTAENSQGVDETGALLNVEQPKEMAVVRDLKDVTAERGNLAHFEAVILNAKSIQWTVNGNNVTSGDQGVTISQDDKFEFRLTLDTTAFKSSNNISIKASNNIETIEKKALLIVTEKPREEDKPQFTDQLKDIEAELGKPLSVDVIALNEPKFKWMLNGQELVDGKDGVRIISDGNKSTLKIDEVKQEHSGQLSVVAENAAGKNESSAKIAVTRSKVPAKITEGPKSVSVNEKESCEFTTKITGYPEPSVKWSVNERIIERSEENIQISQSSTESTLRINQVTVNQEGRIKVEVTNSEGTDSATADLKVKPSEIKPKFQSTLSDAKVAEGEPLSFNVALENASPNTKVSWYLNGKKLEESDKVKITDNGNGNYKLEISAATADMNGQLTVRAENSQGSDESKSKIEVTTGERKPEFSKTPQDHDVEEDTSVKFSAIITGVPEPEITWFLNDVPIVSNEDIRVKREVETGKASIKIFKPKQQQSGKVKVKATNKLGTIESSAELKVSQKKEIPHFLTELSDRQVNEGSDVKFQAKIQGFPEPEVEWTLNGQPIKADNVKSSKSGDLYVIEFNKVQLDQQGELAVEAKNSIGTKKENCTLAVKETGVAPSFPMNLTDRLVEENQTVVMEAQMNKDVKPKPTIEWFKDGQPITDSRYKTSYDESNGILKLTIAQAIPEDKSRITIKAENKWGSGETSASIGVTKRRPMAKPQFLSELAPIQVTEGDSLNAKVIITGDPKPIAKWYINNQLVAQTEDTELKEENGVYSMTIHGCTTDMTGKIKVVAVNRMGEVTTEGKLTVIAPVPVEFETCLCDATCREGDTLKLKAVLLGEPTPTVTWYVNGKKLEETQNIKIHADKGTYTVTIKDITTDYSGKVVCEAVNEFGKASSEATLLVLPRGEPPDFIEWLSNVRARQGSQVVHKVVFTGDPKPTLTWYINNKEVKDGLEGISIKTDNKTSVLTIKNFNPDKHVGEIICKAENDAGEVSCTANMVTYTSDMVSESESEAMAEDVGITDDLTEIGSDVDSVREEITRTPTPVMAPKFITKIKDTKTSKGNQAVFECVVPDTKGVVCKWLKDGKELELIARIRVQTRTIEGHVTNELIIDDVEPEDAGKYTVVVENTHGQVVSEANLTVLESLEKPQQKAPEFTVSLKDKQAKTDDRVSFECKVVGEPSPNVKWFKDEQQIFEQSMKIIIESDEGIQRLVLEKAQTKDTGIYKCVAENSAGKTSTDAKLEVRDQFVALGKEISLECSVRGVPQPTVDFFKVTESGEKIQLITGDRISVQHDASNTHWRVVIRNVEAGDYSGYKAEAKNSIGTAISGARAREPEPVQEVKIEEKPREKREEPESTPGDKTRKLKDGDTAEMSVEVSGKKPPEPSEREPSKPPEYERELSKPPEPSERELSKTPEPSALEGPDAPPKIIQGLNNVTMNEGDNIELVIRVTGKPYPSVTWLKNGEPVIMDGEHLLIKRLPESVFKLILNKLRLDDDAKYTAKAENKLGKDETSGKLTVNEEIIPPLIVEKLKDVEIKELQTIEVCTTATGKPSPSIEWYRNGVKITPDGTRIIEKQEGSHFTLFIHQAKLDESGRYTAKATNKGGSDDSSSTVTVKEDLEPPKFTDVLRSREIKEGQFSELSVSAIGKPVPEVKWYKDGKEIQGDGVRIIIKANPDYGYYSLTIKNANLEDSGLYSAKAVNKAGEDETSAKFKVLEDIERPVVTSGLVSKKIKEGQTTEMSVTVTGRPKPDVKWFKDGNEIFADGTRLSTRVDDDGTYNLIIKDARLSDAGNYTAKISNKAGSTESRADLEVVEDLEPPEFVGKLKSLELVEGQEAELSVLVTGKPEPQVEFFKNGYPVQIDGNRIVLKSEGNGRYTLLIKDSIQDDTASYSAKATNKVGSVETKCKVYVGEHTEAPRFTEKLKDIQINENETAVFECTVIGKPKPEVNWFKDGRPVFIDNKRIFEVVQDSGKRILKIERTNRDDVGTYSCQAVNKIGASSTKCDLKLIGVVVKAETPRLPTFESGLKPQTVKPGEQAVFEAKVDETTKPEVTWFKDGVPVRESDNVILQHLPDGTVKLVIKNAKPEDIGTYKVEVFNPAGKSASEAPLKYAEEKQIPETKIEATEPMPRFESLLQPQTVKPGEQATFEAKVMAYSQPEIKWFKDNQEVKPSNQVLIEQSPDGTVRLTIKNAKPEDIGTYRVEVSTKAGQVQSQAPLKYAEQKEIEKVPDDSENLKPLFIQPLKQQAVKEGDTVTFECKVNEASHPDVQWYRNDVPIDMKPNILIEHRPDGTLRLTVKNVKSEDLGSYRCEAVNKAGKAQTEAPLKYAQMIDLRLPEEEVGILDEGLVEGFVEEPKRIKVTEDKTTKAVETIAHTRAEYVVIQDDIESLDQRGVGAPEFVQLLRSALTSKGGEAVLRCKVKGEPRPTIQWTKQGKPLEFSNRITSEYLEDGSITLTIKDAVDSDAGEYRCEASNDYGSAWTEAPVILAAMGQLPKDGEAPDFVEPVRPVTVKQGSTATLQGKISGIPEPLVKWYKGGKEIQKSDSRYEIESTSDGIQKLILKDAKFEDIGEYRCEITNKWGDAFSDATLTVHAAGTLEDGNLAMVVPIFTRTLQETTAKENEHLEFECQVGGSPLPDIRWLKDGKPIESDQRIKQVVDGDGKAKLVIDKARIADAGKYTCEATNDIGKAKTEAPLHVEKADKDQEDKTPLQVQKAEEKEDKDKSQKAPEFTKNLTPVRVAEGEPVTLEAKVDGNPPPTVRWYKNGDELKPGEGVKIESSPDGLNKLVISESQREDAGEYKVEATNELGKAESKAPVVVDSKPVTEESKPVAVESKPVTVSSDEKPLKLKKGLKDQEVPEGSKVDLGVEVEGKPSSVKWYKDNNELQESRKTHMEKVTDEEYKLSIEKADLNDTGNYRVVLATEKDSVQSSCQVTVTPETTAKDTTEKPGFKKGLSDQKVPKGAPLRLEIEVDGKPKEVKWYRNGNELKPDGKKIKTEDLGDGKYALVIPEVGEEDFGDYSVKVSNDNGTAESKAKVSEAGKIEISFY